MKYWVCVKMCNTAGLNWPAENHNQFIIFKCDNWVLCLTEYLKSNDTYCLICSLKPMKDIGDPSPIHFCLFAVAVLVSVCSQSFNVHENYCNRGRNLKWKRTSKVKDFHYLNWKIEVTCTFMNWKTAQSKN